MESKRSDQRLGMALDALAKQDGITRSGRRRQRSTRERRAAQRAQQAGSGRRVPVTSMDAAARESDRRQRRQRVSRSTADSRPAVVTQVVFGNSKPEPVLTGRIDLVPKQPQPQPQPQQPKAQAQPVSRLQATLARGEELYHRTQQGKSQTGGKALMSAEKAGGRRLIRRNPLLRRLRIVRPGAPEYQQQLLRSLQRARARRVVRQVRAIKAPSSSRSSGKDSAQAAKPPGTASGVGKGADTLSSRFAALYK